MFGKNSTPKTGPPQPDHKSLVLREQESELGYMSRQAKKYALFFILGVAVGAILILALIGSLADR